MKLAVIDTNVIIAAHITKHDDSVTGNKRHFPNADFILSPSEFVEVLNAQT